MQRVGVIPTHHHIVSILTMKETELNREAERRAEPLHREDGDP